MAATVSPEHILKELAQLWASEGQEVLRACTMTLVVVTEQDDDRQELGETLAALMPEHPARTLVVRLTGPGDSALTERVYQQCWMPFGQRRQVCCEQVEISATDGALGDLPSVILPLSVADLPVFLWARSPRVFGMPEFDALAQLADKEIIESGRMNPSDAVVRMQRRLARGPVLGDLAWTRLTRWRNMLAQIFENRERLARLGDVKRVLVRHSGEKQNTSAILLGCWVRDAIGGSAEVAFAKGEWPGAGRAPLVLSIGLEGDGINLELRRDQDRMVTTIDGTSQCTHLPMATPYLLMREELGITRRDPVFEQTLASAARLLYSEGK